MIITSYRKIFAGGGGQITDIDTYYFAKGIGPIKIDWKESLVNDEGIVREWTGTQECIYFSIPGGVTY